MTEEGHRFLARVETFLFRLAAENRAEPRTLLEADAAPE